MSVLLVTMSVQMIISPPSTAAPSTTRALPLLASGDDPSSKLALEPEPPLPDADFGPLARAGAVEADPRKRVQEGPKTVLVAPADDAVLASETPVLKVAATGAGEGTKYCFKVSTGFDGRTGSVAQSGCLPDPQWTVPRNVVANGGRYTWTVDTVAVGAQTPTPAGWVGHFTIDQRTGDPKPTPTDSLGPVTVNLFNGNVRFDASGPGFSALGGSAGVTFAYNSRQGESRGVRASYFNDPAHNGVPGDVPVLVRNESQVDLFWGNKWNDETKRDPLPPGLVDDWYVIRWEGYFQAPVAGDYRFAGAHTPGAKIWVGDRVVYNNPEAGGIFHDKFTEAGPKRDDEVTLAAGQRVPIKVELYHHSADPPAMVLWVKSTQGAAGGMRIHNLVPRIVPAQWLYPADPPPLPAGWTLSMAASSYTHAAMLDGAVVLTDGAGGKHSWAKTAGGYRAPPGRDGVVAFDTKGRLSVTENGVVSLFHPDGTLAEVSTVLDSKKPASLQYRYSGSPSRLTEIVDPVSGRAHKLHYNTDGSNSCYGGAPLPSGANSAPAQQLCRITYWDGTESRLWYLLNVLARIENPGAAMQDFSYTNLADVQKEYRETSSEVKRQELLASIGPLSFVRGNLGHDWASIQQFPSQALVHTAIQYKKFVEEPGVPERLRAVAVTGPSPDGGYLGKRPTHYYGYDIGGRQAIVNVDGIGGLNSPPENAVTWDDAGRLLASTNAVGDTARSEWNVKDQRTATIDTTGRRSTVIYDHADRPIDSYGPAPSNCFTGQLPTPQCANTMPHTNTQYDKNLVGLEAAFYDNPFTSGVPKDWATGVGAAGGSLKHGWGSTPPVANNGGWSGRFTGEIKFPDTGDYALGFTVIDGVRLWIDDVLIVDSWTDKAATAVSGTYTNTTAGSWHRIRIDYYNRSGKTGALDFTWKPPGSGSSITVPGQNLAPRYGLQTGQITENTSGGDTERAPAKKLATSYSDTDNGIDPVLGLAVSKTGDPGGINLTGRMLIEKPGQGYLRQLAAALPGGDLTNPDKRGTSTYYGNSETRSNPCTSNSAAANQGGRVKTVRGPKNSDGTANAVESVYDGAGRLVAARTNSEPWSCVTYDARDRVVEKSFPAMDDKPARTITYDYAVDGNPLKLKVSDNSGSTITMIDLLGQTVSYTDVGGVTTTSTYDPAGRKISETTTVKAATTSTLNYHWDDASRLTGLDLDGARVATPGYTAGILDKVAYGNGSNLAITHNDAGSTTGLTWKVSGSTVASSVTRSRDQRITDETITDTAGSGTTYNSSYTYDGVGRLVAAAVPHHKLTYSFAGDNGCGPNKKAGANTNRTTFTDSFNGTPATTTNYCYDDADRLLSTNGATTLSFTYDTYGNATKVGTDTLGYDSTLRHISTTTAAGRSVVYTRDVTDRITMRTVRDNAKPAQITRYGFTTNSGGPDFVLDDSGTLRQRVLKLPGGALLTKSYTDTKTANWSYPNIHGDILLTTDHTATRTGPLHLYDPYGQNIDPATGTIGDIPIPATAEGGMDFGYLGQHTVPIEHIASQQALEMGARSYLPILGRFLQVDPVPAGSANNYDYVNADPVNAFDLTGKAPGKHKPGQPKKPNTVGHENCSRGCTNPGQHQQETGEPLPSTVSPDGSMLGSNGARTGAAGKTLGQEKDQHKPYWRIDVENSSPGKKPGSLHLQTVNGRGNRNDEKYQYNFNTGQFEDAYGAPPPRGYLEDISKNPDFEKAIQTGGKYLGVPGY
ncbi:PA14 domain-containing protein [Nocardia brasiliensis]|uniref:PA14 domain-containing protein n=1 Tax=Nocardia brasiliensis TaxID=37326 RepID=UPI002454426C|nr:PA14 domain-containing protein [Nocardia brasiliensis]